MDSTVHPPSGAVPYAGASVVIRHVSAPPPQPGRRRHAPFSCCSSGDVDDHPPGRRRGRTRRPSAIARGHVVACCGPLGAAGSWVTPAYPWVIEARSIHGSRGMNGRTASSAARHLTEVDTVLMPIRSKVARTSVGLLPAGSRRTGVVSPWRRLIGQHGVGDAEAEVLVAVEADLAPSGPISSITADPPGRRRHQSPGERRHRRTGRRRRP